jgi:broad specificity phosphatase PhoE
LQYFTNDHQSNLSPYSGSAALKAVIGLRHSHTLIVAHSNFNKIMLAELSGLGMGRMFEIQQGNCCINVLDFDPKGVVTVVALNLCEHLGVEGAKAAREFNARI